jgi:putative transposase
MTTAPEAYSRPTGGAVGMDVGVKTAAVVAAGDGTPAATLEASRALRGALAHIKDLQRALSRTQKGSANRARARRRLGRAHARAGAVRTSRLHQFTAKLAARPRAHRGGEHRYREPDAQPPPGPGHRRPGLG